MVMVPSETILMQEQEAADRAAARRRDNGKAFQALSEIIAHFAENGEQPSDWAHPDDLSEFCLDHQSADGSKFWLDIAGDHIMVLWKRAGAEKPTVIKFVPLPH